MNDTSDLRFAHEAANSRTSLMLQDAFFADIAARYPGWEPSASARADPSDLAPPRGAWIVVYDADQPVGCGGLQHIDQETAEIRRIFLDEGSRKRGIGRALLLELESSARRLGYRRLRLTTGNQQPEAQHLFRSVGYREVAPFTTSIFTHHWMAKELDP